MKAGRIRSGHLGRGRSSKGDSLVKQMSLLQHCSLRLEIKECVILSVTHCCENTLLSQKCCLILNEKEGAFLSLVEKYVVITKIFFTTVIKG